jgi:Zinc-binding dehydrogenase
LWVGPWNISLNGWADGQVIDRIFPFEATKDALEYLETGSAKGKIVIKVR